MLKQEEVLACLHMGGEDPGGRNSTGLQKKAEMQACPGLQGNWTHLQPSGGPVIEKKGAPLVQVADPKMSRSCLTFSSNWGQSMWYIKPMMLCCVMLTMKQDSVDDGWSQNCGPLSQSCFTKALKYTSPFHRLSLPGASGHVSCRQTKCRHTGGRPNCVSFIQILKEILHV